MKDLIHNMYSINRMSISVVSEEKKKCSMSLDTNGRSELFAVKYVFQSLKKN